MITTKAATLRGSSSLAIGRSMYRVVLPGFITACALFAIPENQLRAFTSASQLAQLSMRPDSVESGSSRTIWRRADPAVNRPIVSVGLISHVATKRRSEDEPEASDGHRPAFPLPRIPGSDHTAALSIAVRTQESEDIFSQRYHLEMIADIDELRETETKNAKAHLHASMISEAISSLVSEDSEPGKIDPNIAEEIGTVTRINLESDFVTAVEEYAPGLARRAASSSDPEISADDRDFSNYSIDIIAAERPMAGSLHSPLALEISDPPTEMLAEPAKTPSDFGNLRSQAPNLLSGIVGADEVSTSHDVFAGSVLEAAALAEFDGAHRNPPLDAISGPVPAAENTLSAQGNSQVLNVWKGDTQPYLPEAALQSGQSEPDAVIEQYGTALVRIGAIVEMLSDGFAPEELARIRSSGARHLYLSIEALQAAGIPIAYDRERDLLGLENSLAQDNSGSSGRTAVGRGAGGEPRNSASGESLVATASVGFDSNPFLSDRENPEVAAFRLQLTPSITRSDGRSSFRASGRVEHIEYLGKYGSLQNFGADLAGRHKINERLEANGGVLFRSDILGTDLTNPLSNDEGVTPDIPIIPGGNDVTILGQRQRRTQYGADTGLAFTPSERDELRWGIAWRSDRFGATGLSDSDFFSQQLRYSRQVSADLAIGTVVDASIIEFRNSAFGDAQTVTPQALVVLSLSERLKATGSFGIALTRIETATGDETTRAFAGNLSLCYGGELSNLCLTGARQVLPSAVGGARVQTTGGLSYSLRLSERDRLQLGGNYSTASQPLAALGNEFESINAFARYERDISERSRLFVSGGYLDTSGENALKATNFQAVVGITIKLGNGR